MPVCTYISAILLCKCGDEHILNDRKTLPRPKGVKRLGLTLPLL